MEVSINVNYQTTLALKQNLLSIDVCPSHANSMYNFPKTHQLIIYAIFIIGLIGVGAVH